MKKSLTFLILFFIIFSNYLYSLSEVKSESNSSTCSEKELGEIPAPTQNPARVAGSVVLTCKNYDVITECPRRYIWSDDINVGYYMVKNSAADGSWINVFKISEVEFGFVRNYLDITQCVNDGTLVWWMVYTVYKDGTTSDWSARGWYYAGYPASTPTPTSIRTPTPTHTPTPTQIPKPDFPRLTYPGNITNVGGADINYKWDSAPRATEYWLQIATDSSFTTLVFNKSVQNSNDVLVQGHPNDGTMYCWHVKAGNSSGWSSYSNYWRFINGPDAPPDKPVLTLPLNGSNAGGFDITLEWDRAPRANQYHVQMALDSAFTQIVVDEYIGNFSGQSIINMLDNGRVHYWRVEAGNVLGWSGFTSYWTFTNGPTGLPEIPNLLLPADGVEITDPSVTLTWDMPVRTTELHIQVATDNQFTAQNIVCDESFPLKTQAVLNFEMESETGFFWRLQGWNISFGYGGWSEIRHFMKIPSDLPENPVLIAPTGYQEGETLTFTWNKGERASKYNVQIATDDLFTNVFYDFEVGDSPGVSGVPYFPDNGMDIYWRARAGNLLGWNSSFSEYLTFKNGPSAIPEKPILTIPANNSNVSGPSIRTEWEYTKRSAIYHYQLALDSNFTKLIVDEYYNEVVISVTLNGMPDNGLDLYWRVESGNDLGWSGFSDGWKVTNGELQIPDIPTIISPRDGANAAGPRVTFKWYAVLTASSYDMEIAFDENFTNIVDTKTGITESSTINDGDELPDNGETFYWHVKAKNSTGESLWSTPANFKNGPGDIPEEPVLINPNNGIGIYTDEIYFEWGKANRAFTYLFQAAYDINFTQLFKNIEVSYNTLNGTLTGFPNNGTTFYWRVIAKNDIGITSSLIRDFINGYQPTPTPTATPTSTPIPSTTQTPTPTPIITQTPSSTITPTPTSTVDPNLINLALNKTVNASSYYQTYIPANAVDGDESTVWGALSTSDPKAYLFVDLDRKYQLDNVKIKWTNPHFATQYDIGVSNDLTNWIKVTVNSDGNLDEFNAASLQHKYRYVGIRCLASNTRANGYGVTELEIWGRRPDFTSLKCDLTLDKDRWIPNTDEVLKGIKINISGLNATNTPVPITIPFDIIKLLSPLDPNWTLADNTNDNNINRNKGGDFELYVCGPLFDSKIATFIRNPNAQTKETAYDMTSDLFDTAGEIKSTLQNQYKFAIDITDGSLYLEYTKSPTEIYTYKEFGIKAINGAVKPIRPGDDLLLRFALADYEEFVTPAVASQADKLAVIDKAMIDRAQMYIDERVEADTGDYIQNAVDWNGANQQNIKPFTYFNYDQNVNTNIATYGAVAYSYADQDNVTEYNNYLDQQMEIIKWYYSNDNPRWQTETNPHPEWATWNGPDNVEGPIVGHPLNYTDDTLAPGGSWDNYIYHGTSTNVGCLNTVPITIDIADYYPYQAGYALYMYMLNPNNYQWYYAGKSAGVDCVGLVMRAGSYPNSPYITIEADTTHTSFDIGEWPWTNNNADALQYYAHRRMLVTDKDTNRDYYNLWKISEKVVTGTPVNLDKIVPGDLLYYWVGTAYHVAMIYKIDYPQNTGTPTLTDIHLIESTWDPNDTILGNFGRIINLRTVNTYNNKNWIIGRLIRN